jgi:hypothetical protein
MATTQINNTPIGNLSLGIKPDSYIDVRELNNFVHAFLNDISLIISNPTTPLVGTTNKTSIKTTVRRAEDESFSLQEFTNISDHELLITYFIPDEEFDFNLNNCHKKDFNFNLNIYYRIEAKDNNKSRLEQILGLVDQFICLNYNNNQPYTYNYNGKTFKTELNGNQNKLRSQKLIYTQIADYNFYYAEQIIEINGYYNI